MHNFLLKGFKGGNQFQTLLGVTGFDKTFTMANIVEIRQRALAIKEFDQKSAISISVGMALFWWYNAYGDFYVALKGGCMSQAAAVNKIYEELSEEYKGRAVDYLEQATEKATKKNHF